MFEEASNRITAWLSKIKIISSDQEVVCKWGMTHILLCLVVLMPVSDIHKKLSEKDRKKYRRKGLMILMVEICASAMLCYFALINFSYSIFSAWILLSIMLIGGKIKNGVQAKK